MQGRQLKRALELSTHFLGIGFVMALMAGGCSGCYQAGLVPPPASIGYRPRLLAPETPVPNDRSLGDRPLEIPESGTIGPGTNGTGTNGTTPNAVGSMDAWRPSGKARDWNYIVLHHTASEAGDVTSIHEAHLKNKDKSGNAWLGIGYHFVIGNGNGMGDGEVAPTFRWKQQMHGAHAGVQDYNQRGIGIVLVGNFEDHPPSANQLAALKSLMRGLAKEYAIGSENILGHGSVKATECPGRHFPMEEVVQSLAGQFQEGRATIGKRAAKVPSAVEMSHLGPKGIRRP